MPFKASFRCKVVTRQDALFWNPGQLVTPRILPPGLSEQHGSQTAGPAPGSGPAATGRHLSKCRPAGSCGDLGGRLVLCSLVWLHPGLETCHHRGRIPGGSLASQLP